MLSPKLKEQAKPVSCEAGIKDATYIRLRLMPLMIHFPAHVAESEFNHFSQYVRSVSDVRIFGLLKESVYSS